MNNLIKSPAKIAFLTIVIGLVSAMSHGQVRYAPTTSAKLSIEGTSTLHEWKMTSNEATYEAQFETNADGSPARLTSLLFTVPAESLKSGKSAMDKNAYSALKTDAHKQITFQLTSARIDGKAIACTGKLKIAGTTKQVDVTATYEVLPNKSLTCKGTKKIKMTEYGVEPPSFMFGSVTTGDEITITFEVTLAADIKPVTLN